MLNQQGLITLQERRKQARLSMFFKIVNNQLPSIKPDFLTQARPRRKIKLKEDKDFITDNVLDHQVINNNRGYSVPASNTSEFRNSYFVQTIKDWNHLDNKTVFSHSLEGFKRSLVNPNDM